MAIDVSYRDTYTTSAEDLSRTNKNFIVNEGVAFDGLKVTQSGTPGMSVVVAPGTGYFYGSGSNANVMYEFYSDANETVTIGASGVSGRIDIICLKVDASTGVASIVAVAGTPSGSPAVPATPASHYKLAEVAVGAGVTTITNANITDKRRSVFIMPTGARNQGLINGKIVPTVASNNLTVAIKTLAGTDPSVTNPVGIWIGDTLRWITGALSVTANAGTNWLKMGSTELATREVDLFVYLTYTSTNSIVLTISRIPYGRLQSSFDTTGSTVDNEKGLIYGANSGTSSSDNFVNIGRFAATLSAGAGYTWSVPSFTNANLIQEPIYETRYLSYTPTLSGSSGSIGTFTANPYIGQYKISNNKVHLLNQIKCTNVGSWSGDVRVRLPINPNTNGPDQNLLAGYVAANGANPATASRGVPSYINALGIYYFITGVDTSGLAWGTFVVNDHIRTNGHYYI